MADALTDERLARIEAYIGPGPFVPTSVYRDMADAIGELRAVRTRLAAVHRVLAEHECDEACELFNCDENSGYLVSKDRVRAALGVDGD